LVLGFLATGDLFGQEAAADAATATTEAAAPAEPAAELTLDGVNTLAKTAAIAGHNGFMLVCCALVLFMTAPGLAMFYGGLVRKKNVLSVIMQCMFLMCMMTVLWALVGYSIAFGAGNPFFGSFTEYAFMNGISRTWDDAAKAAVTPMFTENGLTRLTHMLFQGMFFIITPALICGAFAERMKFSAMVAFSILWGLLIYCPLAHMVWGGGWLAYGAEGALMGGALDFAGGTVVHISSGVSALVAAIMIGPRLGFGKEPMPPHNLTYTALGAAMLWIGWFGFNAGSELLSDELTTSAFATTHFAAAAGGLGWLFIEWIMRGKPTVLGVSSGIVAGLVCITPAAGFVQPMPAIIMGLLAGIVCYLACSKLKGALGYDDALDAFGVHGVGGTLGAILTGVFADRACWDIASGSPLGLLEGGTALTGQIAAVLVTYVISIVGSVILLGIINVVIGLRVSADVERQGLDVQMHGEEGYIFL
jgi:Amt family ammonium transporter